MARTRDGHELPVIDVTDPRFAVPDDPAATRALYDAFIDGERRRHRIPKFIMRMMLRRAARKSRMVRALFNSDAGYLDSMTTYMLKLGVDHLPPGLDSGGSPGRRVSARRADPAAHAADRPPAGRGLVDRSPTPRTRRCISSTSRAGRRSTASTR